VIAVAYELVAALMAAIAFLAPKMSRWQWRASNQLAS
jgi:hypothetical protein